MIIPDINLLLYACDSESPFHAKAQAWWESCLSGTEPIGLAHAVAFGFIRIATNARVFQRPMTPSEAATHLRGWISQPNVQLLEAGPDHLELVLKLLERLGTAGNLAGDAQMAAITLEYQGVLHTADTDFMRFPGLRWFNPLLETGSGGLRKSRKP